MLKQPISNDMKKACSPWSAQRFAVLPSLCCTDGRMPLQKTTHFIQDKPASERKAKQTTQVTQNFFLLYTKTLSGRRLRGPEELCRAAPLPQHTSQQHLGSSQKSHGPSTKLQSTGKHHLFKRHCLHNPACLPKTQPHKTNMKDQKESCRAAPLPLHRKMSRAQSPKDMAFSSSDHRAATVSLSAGWTVRAE